VFKKGHKIIEDDYRSGRPSTSNNDEHLQKVRDAVLGSRHLTVARFGEISFK